MIVKKGKRELLELFEHIFTHIALHIDTDHVAIILNEILQKHPYEIQDEKSAAKKDDQIKFLIGNIIIEHISGDDRI